MITLTSLFQANSNKTNSIKNYCQQLVWWMTALSDFYEFIHCNLVVLFLLLDKHITMFNRNVLKERRVVLFHQWLVHNQPWGCSRAWRGPQSKPWKLRDHIFWLLWARMKLGAKEVLSSNTVFTRKEYNLYSSWWIQSPCLPTCKQLLFCHYT